MNHRIKITIYHVVSQLIIKWVPVPELSLSGSDPPSESDNINLKKLNKKDWLEYIHHEIKDKKNKYTWVKAYTNKFMDNGQYLAGSIYDHINKLYDFGGSYILYTDNHYPPLLKMIQDPPLALSVVGNPDLLHLDSTAIIGSRKGSLFALNESFKLGYELSSQKQVVVSGGAIGCDIAAHEGVLATGIKPSNAIVVLAGGLSEVYPKINLRVFRDLKKSGATFISERLWTQKPKPYDFAARNRIISGICNKTVVMQAGIKSGAMITAKKALDQGRDVYVLIHPKDDIRASGNNWLFEIGSPGFTSAEGFMSKSFESYNVFY